MLLTPDRGSSTNLPQVGEDSNDEIAREWRSRCVSPWTWTRSSSQAGSLQGEPIQGEGGGFFVTSEGLGHRRAYLKPTKKERGPFTSRAAREKIVADLAFELGVRVPPALLYRRVDAPAGHETACCVSLVLSPRQYPWWLVKQDLVDSPSGSPVYAAVMNDLPTASARALALNAWVMQFDHDDHPHNIVFGSWGGSGGQLVFLDYALSLGHVWTHTDAFRKIQWRPWSKQDEGWKYSGKIFFPPHMERFLHLPTLAEAVGKIEQFPVSTIQEIVERIPDDYMNDLERGMIIRGLTERRALIRRPLDEQLSTRTAPRKE